MKQKLIILLGVIFLTGILACESPGEKKKSKFKDPNLKEVVVKDVIQTSSYTYLKMEENGEEVWGAVSRTDEIEKGGTYYFDNFIVMDDFPSKELNKTFKNIYFIQDIRTEPVAVAEEAIMPDQKGSPKAGNQQIAPMDAVEGGITLAELFANKTAYAGKVVKIRGKVVKYTPEVMGKNWAHIQDGTSFEGQFDLTVTTAGVCSLGDVATFEGKIVLDQDFGYGYTYDILMENAALVDLIKTGM